MKQLPLSLVACVALFAAPAPLLAQEEPADEEVGEAGEEEESPEEALERRLNSQNVSLNFDATPVSEALDFIRDITGLNVVVFPGVDADAEVYLRLQDVSLNNALKLILLAAGEDVGFQIWSGVICVKPNAFELGKAPQADDSKVGQTLSSRKVTLNFPETPFSEVIAFIQDITGLNVVLEAAAREKADELEVTLRIRDLSLAQALTLATRPHGLTWSIEHEAVVIKVKE